MKRISRQRPTSSAGFIYSTLALLAAMLAPAPAVAAHELRIVSVGGSITETIFALGLGDSVVGADTSSVYPEATLRLPKVGYARRLSAEGVLSLRPTRVIVSSDAGPPEALQQIRDAGIDVAVVPDEPTVAGAKAKISALGSLLKRESEGRALVERLEYDLRAAPKSVGDSSPRVLFVYARGAASMSVSGTDTAANAMIELAGAQNAITGYSGFKPLTPEAAIAAQPDVLLVLSRGLESLGGADDLFAIPGISETPAGRFRRVVAMDDLYLLGFGPRLGQAVGELGRELHTVSATTP